MKTGRRLPRTALLAGAMFLGILKAAAAGTYLVCYLPPDADKRSIRFCPGSSDATAGQPCRCLLRTTTLAGTMTLLALPDGAGGATTQTMCVPRAAPGATVTLCPVFHSAGDTACACEGEAGGTPGQTYSVTMMPRVPLRTNQTAAADFLKRLQECCISK